MQYAIWSYSAVVYEMNIRQLTEEGTFSAAQMLERFLFTPAMQHTPIGRLSGGERRRL